MSSINKGKLVSKNIMSSKKSLNFEDPTTYHDRVLVVGERKFYVIAGTLSLWSDSFKEVFHSKLADANPREIPMRDFDPDVFNVFLQILYQHNSVEIEDHHLIRLIDLSHRFTAPNVFVVCRQFVDNNFNKLDHLKLELLDVAFQYGIEDLKEKLICYIKDNKVLRRFSCLKVLGIAVDHNLHELKHFTISYMKANICCENCSDFLNCCANFNPRLLKENIIKEIKSWSYRQIPPSLIISLTKTAFKHDVTSLKGIIRLNIYNMFEAGCPNAGHGIFTSGMTVNSFLLNNQQEIFMLPPDLSQFIVMSTCTKNVPYSFPTDALDSVNTVQSREPLTFKIIHEECGNFL